MTPKIFTDVEQSSEEWHRLRCGLITASDYKVLFAEARDKSRKAETREAVLARVAAEIITEEPITDAFTSRDMERGKQQEPEAIAMYGMKTGFTIARVGFVRLGRSGCSPDALVGDSRILEVKSMRPDLLVRVIEKNEFPRQYYWQVMGSLRNLPDRQYADLAVYAPGLPLFVKTLRRDPKIIAAIEKELATFYRDADDLVETIRRYR